MATPKRCCRSYLYGLPDHPVGKRPTGAKAGTRGKDKEIVLFGEMRITELHGRCPVRCDLGVVVGQIGEVALSVLPRSWIKSLGNTGPTAQIAPFLIGAPPTPVGEGNVEANVLVIALRIDRARRC